MTCICQGPRCQVHRLFFAGGTLAEEFKAGEWHDNFDETGRSAAVLYDLSACSCPKCDACRNAPLSSQDSMTNYDTPPECEWYCAVAL